MDAMKFNVANKLSPEEIKTGKIGKSPKVRFYKILFKIAVIILIVYLFLR